ncbi:MAG TPA: MFS transporter, partial [Caulobacteraceae bacterium]|nr:MFS transporter [Caulobacteraceae bacterium]
MTIDPFLNRPKLGTGTKVAYGFGSVAYGVAFAGLSGAVLQIYLNQVLGLAPLVVGTAIMVSLMADAVIDPLIGQWSDRVRTRWGRRHPFMYASAIPSAVLFFLLWHAPASLSAGALVAFTVTLMIAVRVSVSCYEIPSNALTPELTPNYDVRTTLQSYRWFFGIIGGTVIILVLNLVFLRTSAANPLGVLNRAGYAHWGTLAAGLMFASVIISTLGTHDQIRWLPKPAPKAASIAVTLREMWVTLTNPSLIALMAAGVLGGVGGGVREGLSVYLYTHFWALDPSQYGLIVPLSALGAIAAVFIAPPLARRFGKKSAMIATFLASVVLGAGPLFLRLIGVMPANGSPWIMPILIIDGAVGVTVAIIGFILVGSMVADVVEDAAVKSGVRSEGLLYAANGLLPKFTGGIGAFFAGVMLTVVHFPAHALKGTVDPQVMRQLVIIYLPVTVTMSLTSIAVLGFYRIDRRTHESNLASLKDAAAAAIASHGVEAVEGGAPGVGP